MKYIYGVLALLGLGFQLWQMVPWLTEHGFDLLLMVRELGSSPLAAFAWTDRIIASLALLVFIVIDGSGRLGMKCILPPVLSTLLIGPAVGLPLFLMMREIKLARQVGSRNWLARPALEA
ncbi:MAG: DUF2834 domain-containing protein [Thiolinea sp.]